MTADELTAAQAKLNELETDEATTRQAVHDAIEGARKLNNAARVGQAKLRSIDEAKGPLRAAIAEHVAAENARLKAEAKVKAEAEAKAKEESDLAKATAEIESLRKQLAAKG